MDLVTFIAVMGITLWLIVLTVLVVSLFKSQDNHRIELMKERARVNKYIEFGNPVRGKIRPILGKSEEVTIDLTELDDEIIL